MHPGDPYDPKRLAIAAVPSNRKPATAIVRWPIRRRTAGGFLKGPIPLRWLSVAAGLPGKALTVGLLCWHLAALRKRRVGKPVQWEPRIAKPFGLNRRAVYRGLAALEFAKLLSVERHRGRCPVITILDCES
jgi:hypothetical protein